MTENAKTAAVTGRAPTFYLIVADKLFKGALALLVALGVYKMTGVGLSGMFDRLVIWMHLDPENRFLTHLGDIIAQITPANLHWVAIGTLLYSLLSLVEGAGLFFRTPWAHWLAIGESAFFIPIEIYELTQHRALNPQRQLFLTHRGLGLLVMLACNVLIVWYLYVNRKRLVYRRH